MARRQRLGWVQLPEGVHGRLFRAHEGQQTGKESRRNSGTPNTTAARARNEDLSEKAGQGAEGDNRRRQKVRQKPAGGRIVVANGQGRAGLDGWSSLDGTAQAPGTRCLPSTASLVIAGAGQGPGSLKSQGQRGRDGEGNVIRVVCGAKPSRALDWSGRRQDVTPRVLQRNGQRVPSTGARLAGLTW